ncbi:hypothetical protein YC2023_043143 [Brassica napus]
MRKTCQRINRENRVKRFGAQEYLEKIFDSLRSYTVIKEAVETVYALLEEHNPVLSDFSFTTIEEGSKSSSEEENEKAFLILNEMILTLKDGKEHSKAACDAYWLT